MRISRQKMFMDIAEVASLRSTCYRANVGAVIVVDNNVVSIGYNGPASGEPHCKGNLCERTDTGGCKRSIHAEVNAIDRANIKDFNNATLYCTHQPCFLCSIKIHNTGIKKVFFMHPYRDNSGLELLKQNGIEVIRITKSGTMINENTGHILTEEGTKMQNCENTSRPYDCFGKYKEL